MWQLIETAPLNERGKSYGPWILGFHKYDNSAYQIRWECHGDRIGWVAKGSPKSIFSHHFTHWQPLSDLPNVQ